MKNILEIDPNKPQNWGLAIDALVHSKYAKPLFLLAVLGVVLLAMEIRGKPKLKNSASWAKRGQVKRCRQLCRQQKMKGGSTNVGLELMSTSSDSSAI